MKYLPRIVIFFAFFAILLAGIGAEDLIHVVGKGDTIYSISRFYQVTPEELMKANGISDPSKLQVGKRLIIPPSAFSDITISSDPAKTRAPVNYKVVKGDTLYSIAKKEGISLQTLLDLNKFAHNHVIKAGDIIKVPGNSLNSGAAENVPVVKNPDKTEKTGDFSVRWPVIPKEIAYMTGQMGVIVEGELFESVKSLTHGRVISAGPWRKFGKVAIVEAAGGYFYMYGGCESLSVKVGDKIAPGTELGKLGIHAVSEKPNLFFMVFRGETPIDPAKAPRAGSVKI